MRYRFLREDRLLTQLQRALARRLPEEVEDEPVRLVVDDVMRWLKGEPEHPRLVGATKAASILGIKAPHISRYREQGRMPDAIKVEGGNDVYVRADVEALARVLATEREARERRRAERTAS